MIYVFNNPIEAYFIKREKRFFSYFRNNDGKTLVAHCVNTGKMSDILLENSLSILSHKTTGTLSNTWEAININNTWIGTNTSIPNRLVEGLLKTQGIPLVKDEIFKKEVTFKFPEKTYRADFASNSTVIEVKHVHWVKENRAYFPDCITTRSSEQMNILLKLKEMGKRIIIIYILQRNDVEKLSVHESIDPVYYSWVKKLNGEIYAFNCNVTPFAVAINRQIEYI